MLRVLDLFSGIGGFSLGLERTGGFKAVAFCEIDPYCRAVLRKHWPDVPIHEDVRVLNGRDIAADVVCGGFPCQPFSVAGKRRGAEDDRHLWPEMRRLVAECRPAWVVGENVPGLIAMGLDTVLSDLDTLEYSVRTFAVPACAVGAPHRRDRLWIVGVDRSRNGPARALYSDTNGREFAALEEGARGSQKQPSALGLRAGELAHASIDRRQSRWPSDAAQEPERWQSDRGGVGGNFPDADGEQAGRPSIARQEHNQWEFEPNVGRVAHGVPSRVDRLRALGNAVVPQIPEIIGRAILTAEKA